MRRLHNELWPLWPAPEKCTDFRFYDGNASSWFSTIVRAAAGYKHEKTKSVAQRAISLYALVAEDDSKYHFIAFSD